MALALSFTTAQRGDNKLVTISDSTGITDVGGWGVGGNPTFGDITDMHIDITITTSDNTVTNYDRISISAPIASAADLVWEIGADDLLVSAVAIGTADDVLPDGLWEITYTYNATATHTDATVLIDGVVKSSIYTLLRTIPTKYECEDYHDRDILDIIFMKGYYDTMIATAVVGREDEVIDQLLVLERLSINGSNNSW